MTKRGTRLENSGLTLDENIRSTAIMFGLDPEKVWSQFWDYWTSVSGQKALRVDWRATFRNCCRMFEGDPKYTLPKKSLPAEPQGSKWIGNTRYSYIAALDFRNRKRNGVRIEADEEQAIKEWGLE